MKSCSRYNAQAERLTCLLTVLCVLTWNFDFPLYRTFSTFIESPWPGHIVLYSVNQPSFMPSSAVPAPFSQGMRDHTEGGSQTSQAIVRHTTLGLLVGGRTRFAIVIVRHGGRASFRQTSGCNAKQSSVWSVSLNLGNN